VIARGSGGGDVGVCIEVVEVSRKNFGSGCAKFREVESQSCGVMMESGERPVKVPLCAMHWTL
jgi:hypothetical protein